MHATHILAYAPVDNYANAHQSMAMYVALAFIAFLVVMVGKVVFR